MINQLNMTIVAQTELIQSLQKTLEADRLEKEKLHQQIEYLTKLTVRQYTSLKLVNAEQEQSRQKR